MIDRSFSITGKFSSKHWFSSPIVFSLLLAGIAALVFLLPVLHLFRMSLTGVDGYTLANYTALWEDTRAHQAIGNTLWIALWSCFISLLLGCASALLVAYTNMRHKKLLEVLIMLPFIIPSYITTLAWAGILSAKGPVNVFLQSLHFPTLDFYSVGGIIFMMGITQMPLVYLSTVHMLRKVPRDLEWSARAAGYSPWETLLKINFVQVKPAILAGLTLAFLSTVDNFAIPAFLGISSNIPVLSTYIYEKIIGFGPNAFGYGSVLSILLAFIAVTGTLAESYFSRKKTILDSVREDISIRIEFNASLRFLLEYGFILLLALFTVFPIGFMILNSCIPEYAEYISLTSLSFTNYEFLLTNPGVREAAINSLYFSLAATFLCIIIGTAFAYYKTQRRSWSTSIFEKGATITYSLPGIVLALALIFNWSEPIPGLRLPLYGTSALLIIGYITRYLILQIKGSTVAFLSVDPALTDAARSSGASCMTRWLRILIPMLVKPILSSAFFIFVSALTELTVSAILSSSNTKTIGLAVFNFHQGGDYSLSAALSTLIVLLLTLVYTLGIAVNYSKGKENHSL